VLLLSCSTRPCVEGASWRFSIIPAGFGCEVGIDVWVGVASEEMPKNENEHCTSYPKGNWLAANLAYSCGLGLVNKKMFRI